MFDSLRFAQRLRDAGADQALAEAFASGISDELIAPMIAQLATKADLLASEQRGDAKLDALEDRMNAKLDALEHRVNAKIEATFARARIEAVGALIVLASLIVAQNRLLPAG